MAVPRIVMRPMHDRQPPRIVHHLTADLDAIARAYRTARRDGDVVDDFDRPGGAAGTERLVHAMGARPVKIAVPAT